MPDAPFYFVHLMKTGGTSVRAFAEEQFEPEECYPGPDDRPKMSVKGNLDALLTLPPERTASLRLYSLHLPYFATTLLPVRPVVLTVLRDPVERVVSHLLQHAAAADRLDDLEGVYETQPYRDLFFTDYQTRLYSLGAADRGLWARMRSQQISGVARPGWALPRLDGSHVEAALENLASTDVVGFTDRLDDLVAELGRRFGWHSTRMQHRRKGVEAAVPDSLRDRIGDDNRVDLEFYDRARDVRGVTAER